jgi:GNAT superfamily N-acetyltransferase
MKSGPSYFGAHTIRVARRASAEFLNHADVAGFFAFWAVRAFKRNTLIFGQAFEAGRLDILEVRKQVSTACIRGDKAEAFSVIEPFHGTGLSSHFLILLIAWAKRPGLHIRPRGITKGIKQDRAKARRERKTNNNDDLM